MKYWRETLAVAQRILTELLHRRRSLIFWAIFPILILLLNGLILEERAQLTRSDAFEVAAPATLVGAALFFSCLGGSVSTVVTEREEQTLKRLFLSPLSGTSYFLGIGAAHSVIGMGQTALVYLVTYAVGGRFNGALWLGIAILLMSIAAYVGLGFILGTQFARRTEDVNALIAAFGVPLLILGGAFMPTEFFPDVLLNLASFNPIFHMVEALSGVSADGSLPEDIWQNLLFLVVFTVLMIFLGWMSYYKMLQRERRL